MAALRFTDRMSDSDALMWDMEKDPRLRSTITALLLLEQAPEFERFRHEFDRAVRILPRFRQRVATPPLHLSTPIWVDDTDFELDFHVRHASVAGGSLRDVLDLAGVWAMAGLDRARPLWEVTLLSGLEDGGAACLLKVHHSMIDGVGGMRLAGELLSFEPTGPERVLPALPDPRAVTRRDLVLDALGQRMRGATGAVRTAPHILSQLAGGLLRPRRTVRDTVRMARSVAKLVVPATSMLSPIMTGRSTTWRYDVLDVDFDDLKKAAHRCEASLNDAFVAAVCGGLRLYHERRGWPVDELRMTMPVNIRTEDEPVGGNRISPLRFRVPVGIVDPAKRVSTLRDIMRSWRAEPAIAATEQLAGMLNALPTSVMTAVFGGMLTHVDFLTSNVPGIPVPCWLAGSRVLRWYALGATEGSAMNVTLMSHDGTCCIGINTDRAAVTDPELMRECLAEGFAELCTML